MDDAADASGSPAGGYRVLIDNFPNGVIVLFDADLQYRFVGPDTLPFSKRDGAEMVGKAVYELFPSPTSDRLEIEMKATIGGMARSFDVEYEERIHHIETKPVEIDGAPFGILVTQEVTGARQTEAELKRQNERLDQFASMVSHDLRNPLAIAFGKLSLYRDTGDRSHLAALEDALGRIDELTEDLLALVRTPQSEFERSPVSLAGVSASAWSMIDHRSATLEPTDATLTGDESQLQALLENLFRNAVGHGGEEVIVRVGPTEDGFFVEDTGGGISAEDREQVFEHGFSTGYGGNGVGLTVVNRIAQAHGWNIRLDESDEGGARFEFYDVDSAHPSP